MATEEKISNSDATVEIAENLQESTKAEVLDDNIQATPSAEHTPVIIHPEVQEAGITAVHEPHHEMLSGSEVHAGSVDGSNIIIFPTRSAIEKDMINSRTHLSGPINASKTWHEKFGEKMGFLNLFRKSQASKQEQSKAA